MLGQIVGHLKIRRENQNTGNVTKKVDEEQRAAITLFIGVV